MLEIQQINHCKLFNFLFKRPNVESDNEAPDIQPRVPPTRMHERERIVAFYHDVEEPLDESTWMKLWIQRMNHKFTLRIQEAGSNLAMRLQLLEMLRAANEV